MLMKRIHIIVDGYVQKVGFREYVHKETFDKGISGYVKNLDSGKVEIIAEGRKEDLQTLIHRINITHYPIAVTECNVTWQEATGGFKKFEIIRGDIQEEIFERIDYAGVKMHETLEVSKETLGVSKMTLQLQNKMLDKQDQMLGKQDQMLDKQDQMLGKQDQMLDKQDQMLGKQDQMLGKQDQMLDVGKEIKDEITGLRKDTGIKKELISIKDALSRAGIKV